MNNEMLDKIQELRLLYPDAEIIFLVNSEECTENSNYTKEEISSVTFDTIIKIKREYDTLFLVSNDDILEYIENDLSEDDYSASDGDIELLCSDEEIEDRAKEIFNSYIKYGMIQKAIIVKIDK